jgi:hypothetical protein
MSRNFRTLLPAPGRHELPSTVSESAEWEPGETIIPGKKRVGINNACVECRVRKIRVSGGSILFAVTACAFDVSLPKSLLKAGWQALKRMAAGFLDLPNSHYAFSFPPLTPSKWNIDILFASSVMASDHAASTVRNEAWKTVCI